MTLTLEDVGVIASVVAAIVVGIDTIAFTAALAVIDYRERALKAQLTTKPVDPDAVRVDYSLDSITEVFVEVSRTLDLYAGLLRENVESRDKISEMPGLSRVLMERCSQRVKAMQELMLASGDETRTRSAIQQLSQARGDARSLEQMTRALDWLGGNEGLEKGIEYLKQQLSRSS